MSETEVVKGTVSLQVLLIIVFFDWNFLYGIKFRVIECIFAGLKFRDLLRSLKLSIHTFVAKYLKDKKHNSLYFARKYARIFVLGQNLFLEAHNFFVP